MTTPTLMSAAQHRVRAEQLRKNPSQRAQQIACAHAQVAALIEYRDRASQNVLCQHRLGVRLIRS